jgi:hypothetical protein
MRCRVMSTHQHRPPPGQMHESGQEQPPFPSGSISPGFRQEELLYQMPLNMVDSGMEEPLNTAVTFAGS